MATANPDKYYLKTVHQEIDLFDRKIAHALAHGTFASEEARVQETRKLNLKREALVKVARKLAAEGIEFQPNELPRSFRPKDAVVTPAVVEEQEAAEPFARDLKRETPRSAYAGTSLDWQQSVRQYMDARRSKGQA